MPNRRLYTRSRRPPMNTSNSTLLVQPLQGCKHSLHHERRAPPSDDSKRRHMSLELGAVLGDQAVDKSGEFQRFLEEIFDDDVDERDTNG